MKPAPALGSSGRVKGTAEQNGEFGTCLTKLAIRGCSAAPKHDGRRAGEQKDSSACSSPPDFQSGPRPRGPAGMERPPESPRVGDHRLLERELERQEAATTMRALRRRRRRRFGGEAATAAGTVTHGAPAIAATAGADR